MELRHLRYFAAVAETCHFGAAAQRLHIAQPALSQAIRQLEAELGASLFLRTTRQVSLTPAGRYLQVEAARILEAVDETARGVQRIADGRLGLVRIGFTGTAVFTQLPRITRVLQQELPGVTLEMHADLLTPAQCEALRDGRLDLAVLRPPLGDDQLAVRTIEVESLVLALPIDHPLAACPRIEMADLRAEGFVLYSDRDSVVNEATVRSCREGGFAPRREHEATGTTVLLAQVAAGRGIALVPGSVRAMSLVGVVFREVAHAASIEIALAWRRGAHGPASDSPLVRSVVDVLEAAGTFVAPPGRQVHSPNAPEVLR